jgi:hypothetical protein
MIASEQMVMALSTAGLPTFAVLVGILINNQKLKTVSRSVDLRFAETNRHIDYMKDILLAEMHRITRC